ncbi:MAG: LysR family transcriptional regulator [Myxococcota bacterium]
MDRLHAMQVFVRVAETRGFAETARQLRMSPPAVTRAVASLEETIGTRLLTRTTRKVTLTEAGARYVDDCRRILADVERAEATAAGSFAQPTGTLTVTASVLFGQQYVLPILVEFLDHHVAVVGRALLLDRVTHLVDEGIDVAIRIGHLRDSSNHAIRVGQVRRVICGSPRYFERCGTPRCPDELVDHTIISATSAWSPRKWRFGGPSPTTVTVKPRLYCNTNEGALAAAVSGWGLTRLLSYQVAAALREGSLRTVLGTFEHEPMPVHIVHPEGRHASAKVRAFVDFAAERLRERLRALAQTPVS